MTAVSWCELQTQKTSHRQSKRKEASRLGREGYHASAGPGRLGLLGREKRHDFAQFGANLADGGGKVLGKTGRCFARAGILERGMGALRRDLRGRGARTAVSTFERLAGTGDGVAFAVHEALDFESQFDLAAAIETLAGAALVGLELGKLGFPKAKDVGLDTAKAGDIADFEIQPIGDDGNV
jgi:hypothetical protein